MTITIRDHITGEAIRSWYQPGNRNTTREFAEQYAVGPHAKVLYHNMAYNVYVIPEVEETE
jgi:hypothetical protein